jgi:hypothetical protein
MIFLRKVAGSLLLLEAIPGIQPGQHSTPMYTLSRIPPIVTICILAIMKHFLDAEEFTKMYKIPLALRIC